MTHNKYYSDDEYQFETHRSASGFYSEILPLSQSDKDNFWITMRLSDDIDDIVHLEVELMDAAISGDARARWAIHAGLERLRKDRAAIRARLS